MAGLKNEPGNSPWERHLNMLDLWPWGTGSTRTPESGNYYTSPFFEEEHARTDAFIITAPVGQFPPNPLGFYDLGGNVWEFTSDVFQESNKADRQTDRTARGGGWRTISPELMRTSYRLSTLRDRPDIGFRCVLATESTAIGPNEDQP